MTAAPAAKAAAILAMRFIRSSSSDGLIQRTAQLERMSQVSISAREEDVSWAHGNRRSSHSRTFVQRHALARYRLARTVQGLRSKTTQCAVQGLRTGGC